MDVYTWINLIYKKNQLYMKLSTLQRHRKVELRTFCPTLPRSVKAKQNKQNSEWWTRLSRRRIYKKDSLKTAVRETHRIEVLYGRIGNNNNTNNNNNNNNKFAPGKFALAINDVISRANSLLPMQVPATKEPTRLSRSDGIRPDCMTHPMAEWSSVDLGCNCGNNTGRLGILYQCIIMVSGCSGGVGSHEENHQILQPPSGVPVSANRVGDAVSD